MSRIVARIFLAITLAAPISVAAESRPAQPAGSEIDPFEAAIRLDRAVLIRAVLDRSPTLEAARQSWVAATEKITRAGALDDPTLTYSLAPLSIGNDGVRYGQIIGFSQRLPYPGKRGLQERVAAAGAEASKFDLETAQLELATLASLLFDDYYMVHRAIEINDEHIGLLESFRRIATARYAAGTAPQQDPLQAEVEIAYLLHRRVVLDTTRRNLVAEINALIRRRPELSLPPPPTELTIPEPFELQTSILQQEALENRPELSRLKAATDANQSRVELERLEARPDFVATGGYNSMWNQDDHRWLVGVGVTLPLYRKRLRSGQAEAEANLQQSESDRLQAEDDIRSAVQIAIQRLEEARHVVELYRSRVVPASRDQVSAALAGFKTGGSDFLVLIEAERSLRTAKLQYQEALAGVFSRQAELERQIGRYPGTLSSLPGGVPDTSASLEHLQGDSP